jgi:hypothetical protein
MEPIDTIREVIRELGEAALILGHGHSDRQHERAIAIIERQGEDLRDLVAAMRRAG